MLEETTYMKQLRHSCQVTGKVAFSPLWDAFSTLVVVLILFIYSMHEIVESHPSYQYVLGQCGIWVFDFKKSKLYSPIRKLIDEIQQFALCIPGSATDCNE